MPTTSPPLHIESGKSLSSTSIPVLKVRPPASIAFRCWSTSRSRREDAKVTLNGIVSGVSSVQDEQRLDTSSPLWSVGRNGPGGPGFDLSRRGRGSKYLTMNQVDVLSNVDNAEESNFGVLILMRFSLLIALTLLKSLSLWPRALR